MVRATLYRFESHAINEAEVEFCTALLTLLGGVIMNINTFDIDENTEAHLRLREQVLAYRNEKRCRHTAAAVAVHKKVGRTNCKTAVLLVQTKGAHARGKKAGKLAYNFPKGGVDSCDNGCPVSASMREMWEETGVDIRREHFSGMVFGPVEIPVDPDDLPTLKKKGYTGGKKAHYYVCFQITVTQLPPVKRQPVEIVGHKWVASRKKFEKYIAGNSPAMRKALRQALVLAHVPWMM